MHEAPHSAEPPAESDPLLYTPEQAAKIVNLSRFWLVKLAREGQISHHRIGKLYRFSRENLDEFKDASAQPARRGA